MRLAIGCCELPGQMVLEAFVVTSRRDMIAQIIAKGQGPSFLGSASFDHVNVMAVRPLTGAVEEGTERVVSIRNMDVAEGLEAFAVCRDRLKRSD